MRKPDLVASVMFFIDMAVFVGISIFMAISEFMVGKKDVHFGFGGFVVRGKRKSEFIVRNCRADDIILSEQHLGWVV